MSAAMREHQSGWPAVVSIVGAAGHVGASVAARLATEGHGARLHLQDLRANVLESHRIDLGDTQALLGVDAPELLVSAPAAGAADLVILAASRPETPDGDRRDFLLGNLEMLDSLAEQILTAAGDTGVLLVLTNPVDIVCDWLCRYRGFDPARVIGYSLNDSARFRRAVATALEVPVSQVAATVAGEHGAEQVPLFSSVRVAGDPVELSAEVQAQILTDLSGWFPRWSALGAGRSSSWATGYGTVEFLSQLFAGEPTVASVSTSVARSTAGSDVADSQNTGLAEVPDTFLSLPVRFGPHGVQVETAGITPSEWERLVRAGHSIRSTSEGIGSVLPDRA